MALSSLGKMGCLVGIRSGMRRNVKNFDIWCVEKEHNRTAVWLEALKKQIDRDMKNKQEMVKIDTEKVKKQSRKLPNWKAPGLEGVCRVIG